MTNRKRLSNVCVRKSACVSSHGIFQVWARWAGLVTGWSMVFTKNKLIHTSGGWSMVFTKNMWWHGSSLVHECVVSSRYRAG